MDEGMEGPFVVEMWTVQAPSDGCIGQAAKRVQVGCQRAATEHPGCGLQHVEVRAVVCTVAASPLPTAWPAAERR